MGGGGISGRVRALNLTVPLGSGRVGSDNLGYGPGSGFSFEPVQTSTANGNSVFKLGFTLYKNKPARDNTHVSRKFHISQCLHPHAFNMSDPLAFILVKFCKCQSIKSCQLYVNVNKVNMLLQR